MITISNRIVTDTECTIRTNEVELCEQWITKFCKPAQRINRNIGSSYGLKNYVKRYFGTYVASGAFIQAAINKGYKHKQIGNYSHRYFNIILPRKRTREYMIMMFGENYDK